MERHIVTNLISAKEVTVIETVCREGSGEEGDPIRMVKKYWKTDGALIAYVDPFNQTN